MVPMTTEPKTITFDPMTKSVADILPGGKRYTLDDLGTHTGPFDPLKTEPTCDRVRDLMPSGEFAGKIMLTCDKPLGHDRRGPHRMRNEAGKTTCTWTGPADND